jgi:hypothetical protein
VDKLLKTTYTYTITNTVLGTIVYVGKSINPKHRWKVHKSCVKCIGKPNEKFVVQNIHYHIAEFGIENFVFSVFADFDCEAQLQEQIRPICCVKYESM